MKNLFKNLKTIFSGLNEWSSKNENTKVTVSGVNSSVITINGQTIVSGSLTNGRIFTIDGQEFDVEDYKGNITINIHGEVKGEVSTISGDIKVDGNSGDIITTSGDITVGGNVSGSVKTVSGDVRAKTINGKVKTVSGDIKS